MTIVKVEDTRHITCMWYAQEVAESAPTCSSRPGSTRSTSKMTTTTD